MMKHHLLSSILLWWSWAVLDRCRRLHVHYHPLTPDGNVTKCHGNTIFWFLSLRYAVIKYIWFFLILADIACSMLIVGLIREIKSTSLLWTNVPKFTLILRIRLVSAQVKFTAMLLTWKFIHSIKYYFYDLVYIDYWLELLYLTVWFLIMTKIMVMIMSLKGNCGSNCSINHFWEKQGSYWTWLQIAM